MVCYINSTAEVKAESDVCVTSGTSTPSCQPARGRVIFVARPLMATERPQSELKARGVMKEIIS